MRKSAASEQRDRVRRYDDGGVDMILKVVRIGGEGSLDGYTTILLISYYNVYDGLTLLVMKSTQTDKTLK